MGRVIRKNLMIDSEALSDLARRRGTTESDAARQAVAQALAAHDMVAAMETLHRLGAFDDYEVRTGPRATDRRRVAPVDG